jgi:hypothetical protein
MLQLQLHRAEEEAAERLMKLGQAEAAGAAAERRARALEAQLHEAREQGRAHAEEARAQRRQLHQQAQAAWQAWARCEAPASGGACSTGEEASQAPRRHARRGSRMGAPHAWRLGADHRPLVATQAEAARSARDADARTAESLAEARGAAQLAARLEEQLADERGATLARARPSSPDRLGSLNSRAPLPPTSWQARCCARRARGRR